MSSAPVPPPSTSNGSTGAPGSTGSTGRQVRASRRRRGWRRLLPTWQGLLATLLVAVILVGGAFTLGYVTTPVPSANTFATSQTSVVYYSDGRTVLGRYADENRVSVPLSQVPVRVQHAVVAAEDRTFFDNRGVDPAAIARAAWGNVRGDGESGASTITQQYVKNYYLTQDRTWSRKLQELFIALKIDQQKTKEQILEDYLNTIWFGRGAYGVQTASLAYFAKPVGRLSLAEGAALAALIQSPARLDPAGGPDNVARLTYRFRYVLDGMVSQGWLTRAQAAKTRLPRFAEPRTENRLSGPRGFLLESVVRDELRRLGFTDEQVQTGGLRVTSTIDRTAQDAVEQAVAQERPTQSASGVKVAVASVRPATGELVAMYGGPDYAKDQRNWALTGRQPGSTFKPFAMTAALEDGYTLSSPLAGNSPFVLPDGTRVRNEFNRSYGASVSLLTALQESVNTAFTDLTQQIGPRRVVDAAVAAGVPKDAPSLQASPSVTLGVASVTPVDMANAYATYAADGRYTPWTSIETVKDRDGTVLYSADPQPKRVFSPDAVASTTYAMSRVVQGGTGQAAQALGRPAAGKTGTSALRPDTVTASWFVGFTPQLSTAVMYVRGSAGTGDLDGVGGLSTFFGGEYPARTWTAAMSGMLDGQPVVDFAQPSSLPVPQPVAPQPTATTQPAPTQPAPTQPAQTQPAPTPTRTARPSPRPSATTQPTQPAPALAPSATSRPRPSATAPTPSTTAPPAGSPPAAAPAPTGAPGP